MQIQALALHPVDEADGVVRVVDSPEHVLLPPHELVPGHYARLELREVVGPSPDPDPNRGLLLPVRTVQNLLDAGFPVFEGRFNDHVPDSQLLHYVAGLEHVARPFVGLGAAFQALDREDDCGALRRRGARRGELGAVGGR